MALRNSSRLFFDRFKGLNSYIGQNNVKPDWFNDSMNVVIGGSGSAEALRSPKAFNVAVSSGAHIISMADFLSPTTHKLLFDVIVGVDLKTYTIDDALTNTLVRTQTASIYPFSSAVVNSRLYRTKRDEFIQFHTDAATSYLVGITAPTGTPTISYVAGGSGAIADGIQASYAYYNTTTGHVSVPCPISNRLGASGALLKLRIPTVASVQTGVDKIVFFITLDGGAIPYLLIDASGNPITVNNATANNDISIASFLWDTLTPEPIFNNTPPAGAQTMFVWKDRVFLLNFIAGSTVSMSGLAYSGFESTYIGIPGESWPTLNRINIPAKGEALKGGIGTQVGALLLSDLDAYLISGYPTDKTSGPEASTSVSEHLEPLHWNIGTLSPRSLKNTPFGTIWLDNAKRLRLWKGEGYPTEIGLPLRSELADLLNASLESVEAQWFQMGDHGGYYVLTGTITGDTQQLYIITIYEDPETREQQLGYGISNISAYSLQPVRVSNNTRLFIGGLDRCYTILEPAVQGDAWPTPTSIFFEIVLGNDGNFGYWHSLRVDGDVTGLVVTIRDPDVAIGSATTVTMEQVDSAGESYFGMLDTYGRRKLLRFTFNRTPDGFRQIENLQVFYQNKKRNI